MAPTARFTEVNVELLMLTKSTWNLESVTPLDPLSRRKNPGVPAGGAVAPSRFAGSRLGELVEKHTPVAFWKLIIAFRSNAHASAPRKYAPLQKRFAEK